MLDDPDFRSDKMDSLEGLGVAHQRWERYHASVPDDFWAKLCEAEREHGLEPLSADESDEDIVPEEVMNEIARSALEDSEMLGFYLAWHLTGGFAKLQEAGWHRVTIHRKIRRFRARFGRHPDEFRLPWLKLDLEKAWKARLVDQLDRARYEPPDDF